MRGIVTTPLPLPFSGPCHESGGLAPHALGGGPHGTGEVSYRRILVQQPQYPPLSLSPCTNTVRRFHVAGWRLHDVASASPRRQSQLFGACDGSSLKRPSVGARGAGACMRCHRDAHSRVLSMDARPCPNGGHTISAAPWVPCMAAWYRLVFGCLWITANGGGASPRVRSSCGTSNHRSGVASTATQATPPRPPATQYAPKSYTYRLEHNTPAGPPADWLTRFQLPGRRARGNVVEKVAPCEKCFGLINPRWL